MPTKEQRALRIRQAKRKNERTRARVIAHAKAKDKPKSYRKAPKLRRAYERGKAFVATLVRRQRESDGPQAAIREAGKHLGDTERPAGSNRGPGIVSRCQEACIGYAGVPWCGCYVFWCLRAAGVKGLTSRVASVAFIEDDARAGRNGFSGWHSKPKPGDVVVLFGRGVHTALVVSVHSWGVKTREGNTSFAGSSGSQSNGGCCAPRDRAYANCRGFARPRYP